MMHTVYFDLETFAGFDKPSISDIKAPENYKDEAKILAYKEEHLDVAWRKQALDSFKGVVISCAYAIDNNPVQCIFNPTSEKDLMTELAEVFTSISYPLLVTHNGKRFDFVWLWHRAVKYKLNALRTMLPHKDDGRFSHVDIMDVFSVTAYGSDTWKSLDDMCLFLGLNGKGGIKGDRVHNMFLEGKYDDIINYNKNDTEMIRTIYKMIYERNQRRP